MIQAELASSCRHILGASDLTKDDYLGLIQSAIHMKESGRYPQVLAGQSVALLFEKPSLRTRVSFEAGIHKLGGNPIYLDHKECTIGEREPINDLAEYLSRSVNAIVARVHSHKTLNELAEHASIPIVNALSNREHPCQALADLMTISEHIGSLGGTRLAYIGDGNNVCHSLMLASATTGIHLTVITPAGHGPANDIVVESMALASISGAELIVTSDLDAVVGHNVVYADTWISMGQDSDSAKYKIFLPYKVTQRLMKIASEGLDQESFFMHCMPAHRGIEVDANVIDNPSSLVYTQAENRLYAQNALLVALLTRSLESPEV